MKRALESFHPMHAIESLLETTMSEKFELNRCLREVGERRKKALGKLERNRRLGTHLTTFTEDDKYVDDGFYQKKLLECYDRYTRSRHMIGVAETKK